MTAPMPPPDADDIISRAGTGGGDLPSLVEALIEDRDRAEGARRALQDVTAVGTWAARFALLSDENRLKILLAVHRAPGITVGDIASAVGMSDNATSQALAALRLAGVVSAARDGRYRRWSITDADVHDLLHTVGASHSALHPHH